MKAILINSKFDEIRALRWREKPLATSGKVVVYEPRIYGQPSTVLVVYDDGTLWSTAISGKPKDRTFYSVGYVQVNIYPHDKEFGGLFHCLVKAGLVSKRTAELVIKAARAWHRIDHPGRIGDHRIKDFAEAIKTYGSVAGMKRAKRAYDRLIEKDVTKAIEAANSEYAKRIEAAKAKAAKAEKRKAATK